MGSTHQWMNIHTQLLAEAKRMSRKAPQDSDSATACAGFLRGLIHVLRSFVQSDLQIRLSI